MYAIREALAAFRRAPVLTGLASAMVGLALYVIGLLGLATYNLQQALSTIEDRGGADALVKFLTENTGQTEITHTMDSTKGDLAYDLQGAYSST